jgi:PadR family transcriptional regulator, regulatory protein PadR
MLLYLVPLGKQKGDRVRIDKDLVAASATPLVLGILADGESYGYAILKRVNELSAGRLTWTDGMLYPLLHRLERLGYAQTTWHEAPSGRRRKHYAITPAGLDALAERRRQWEVVSGALDRVWRESAAVVTPPAPASAVGR